jgi:hypothetical protein
MLEYCAVPCTYFLNLMYINGEKLHHDTANLLLELGAYEYHSRGSLPTKQPNDT